MQPSTRPDSFDWPLICTAVTVAVLIRLSLAHGAYGIVPVLSITMIGVALWLTARLVGAVRRREVLGITSVIVAAIFIYVPWLAAKPWIPPSDAPVAASSSVRLDDEPISYRLRVATFKWADPARTFIVFKAAKGNAAGGVERRVAYDETDTLARGDINRVIALARSQSPQDVAEFSECGWRARRVEGHYYVVDFSC